jgi:translation elongation factor EF-1alpha
MIVSDLVSKVNLAGKVAVGGKVAAGAVAVNSSVRVWPSGERATVKALEVAHQAREAAVVGDAVVVGLGGIEPEMVSVGSCICHPEFPVHCSKKLRVSPLSVYSSLLLHYFFAGYARECV